MFVCVHHKVLAPIVCETLLTNMTNDVADNDAAYCSIHQEGKKWSKSIFALNFTFIFPSHEVNLIKMLRHKVSNTSKEQTAELIL